MVGQKKKNMLTWALGYCDVHFSPLNKYFIAEPWKQLINYLQKNQ